LPDGTWLAEVRQGGWQTRLGTVSVQLGQNQYWHVELFSHDLQLPRPLTNQFVAFLIALARVFHQLQIVHDDCGEWLFAVDGASVTANVLHRHGRIVAYIETIPPFRLVPLQPLPFVGGHFRVENVTQRNVHELAEDAHVDFCTRHFQRVHEDRTTTDHVDRCLQTHQRFTAARSRPDHIQCARPPTTNQMIQVSPGCWYEPGWFLHLLDRFVYRVGH